MSDWEKYVAEYKNMPRDVLMSRKKDMEGHIRAGQGPVPQHRLKAIEKVLEGVDDNTYITVSLDYDDMESRIAWKYLAKKQNAMERGIEFSLSLSDMRKLMLRKTCYYTGIPLLDTCEPSHPGKRTLDRINPDEGYTKENTVACSNVVNSIKNTVLEQKTEGSPRLTIKQLQKMVQKVSEHWG